jgi:quercetin dioxygenase-like cupin family protein
VDVRPVVFSSIERAFVEPQLPDGFIGRVLHHDIGTEAGPLHENHLRAVYFEAGARTRPHLHSFDQVLCFIQGPGMIAVGDGDDQIVPEGAFVVLPANVPHMHGATADAPAAHITYGGLGRGSDHGFDCEIPDEWRHWREPS